MHFILFQFIISPLLAIILQVKSGALAYPYGVTVGITPYAHPVQSLYHAQDAFGQYVYGYATPTSAKSETKTADGVTRGGYSYIDSNGILQTVQYTADALNGFRVAATNLPQDLPEVCNTHARNVCSCAAMVLLTPVFPSSFHICLTVISASVLTTMSPLKNLYYECLSSVMLMLLFCQLSIRT